MKAIDGLYFHEMVLLGLGTLLFIVVLVLLVIFVIQKRKLKELIVFFIISIIMIGYPSIQKIKYEDGVFTFEKEARLLAQNPDDDVQRSKVETTLSKIENRPTSKFRTLVEFGKAQAILGDTVKAENHIVNALALSPGFSEAKMLRSKFNTPQVQIERLITEIENNPVNESKKAELKKRITTFEVSTESSSSILTTAAKVNAVLGDTSKALSLARSALMKDPENRKAAAVQDQYARKKIQR